MGESAEQFVHGVMSGERTGVGAALLRGVLRAAEPVYAGIVMARNALYATGASRVHRLAQPVVSVGNITAGGTGKTPVVRWLAERLREGGMRPAVLMRGYKRVEGGVSDEEEMLRQYLGAREGQPAVVVHAQPDRVAGAKRVLAEHPGVDVFILDDGFQHRRMGRDFELVLIDASNPFGYGHVHPRGLLREPMRGLSRADAFILTRSDSATAEQVREICELLRAYCPTAPVYRATHAHAGFREARQTLSEKPALPIGAIAGRRFFAFAGIANPKSLEKQLGGLPGTCVGGHWFADHHAYGAEDLREMRRRAKEAGAEVLVVTEKDFVKLARLEGIEAEELPVWRLEVEVKFAGQGEEGLLELIRARIESLGA